MKICTRAEQLYHRVRCGTCAPQPDGLTPGGVDREGRSGSAAARAHLRQFPDHEVSMSYAVEVAFFVADR